MDRDRDSIRGLYDSLIQENITPLGVKKSATGDGETGGLEPGDLPADTASTTEVQKATGSENAKDVKSPEEAEKKLNPVKKDKGTNVKATKKKVTSIKDSTEPRKSFMDLFDQVMVKEEEGDIEDPSWDAEAGDFPEPEGEMGDEEGLGEEMSEGEIYSQLADLFGQLASIKGADLGGMEDDLGVEDEMAMGDEMGEGVPAPAAESVKRKGKPIREFRSEPEPKEFSGDVKKRQLPTKLADKGVTKGPSKKAAVKGNDKKRTGELESGPEGFKHDKSKYAVKGDGPVHTAKNSSFLES